MIVAEPSLSVRNEPQLADAQNIREMLVQTGLFHPFEIPIALQLLEERLVKGWQSDYHFLFLDVQGKPVGYICYGPVAMTDQRYDIYWICVQPEYQGKHVGRKLLEEAEAHMRKMGGKYVFIQTSSRPIYESTRQFYMHNNYQLISRIPQYYADDDDCLIFRKEL